MNPNIINPGKYKKITKNDKEKKDKLIVKNIKKNKYKKNNKIALNKTYINKQNKKKKSKNNGFIGFLKVTMAVLVIVSIGFVSKFIVENPDTNILINVFGNNDKNLKLDKEYDFKIGINNLDVQNNILINELYKYSYKTLIHINKDYNFEYNIAKSIIKKNDLNYEILVKDMGDIQDIIYTIEKLKSKNDNRYYRYLSNVSSLEIKEQNIISITLNTPNEYFVYSLDFKIDEKNEQASKQNNTNIFKMTSIENGVKFYRNENVKADVLKSISIENYSDSDILVDKFRNNKIDSFLTSSEEDIRLIGRHEYNIKKYRDGETYFLLGNKNSELFKLKEVRKALAYSLNRNEICKKLSNSFTEVIDIPYIYSEVRYKYDIYGAENGLIAESWNKSSGIYSKKINGVNKQFSLNLLVNIDDLNKILISDNIKLMLENIGIKINIFKLSQKDIEEKIKVGDYDLVLSTINISNNPNIDFLEEYLNINAITDEAFNKVKNSSLEKLSENVQYLQSVLSDEIACVGIAAKNTDFVYQKYIQGFEDVSYNKIFQNIEKIGKIVQ